jgi:hypothetical protein
MHETSYGQTIRDYLSGEEIVETTYEEFRQALARMLVEERGYPKERLAAKVEIAYRIGGKEHARALDIVALDEEGKPLLVVIFCSGKVGTFERETAVAGRLAPGGPAPLALATDTKEASLMVAQTGQVLARGMEAVPHWDDLIKLAREHEPRPLTDEDRAKLTRIFHAYSGFLVDSCCNAPCCGPVKS